MADKFQGMIIVLDFTKGDVFHFKTRIAASTFIGVSKPTFRIWLREPFYLYRTLLIIESSNEKIERSTNIINARLTSFKHKTNGKEAETQNAT